MNVKNVFHNLFNKEKSEESMNIKEKEEGTSNSESEKIRENYDWKSTKILRSILEVSFKKDSINESSKEIIKILKDNYKLDYVTILIKKDNTELTEVASSDIEEEYLKKSQEYFTDVLKEKDLNGKIKCSKYPNTFLSYPTAEERKIQYFYFIPLKTDTDIGALIIENKTNSNLFSEEEFFRIIIENITIVMENCIFFDKLNSLAMRDGLTGIYNRNFMKQHLEPKIKEGKSFNLVIFDIDHFKRFNDTYGHLFGDITLKEVSNHARNFLHQNDCIYRYGGEEFIIYLEDRTEEEAYKFIENLRISISNIIIEDGVSSATVTVSFGIYQYSGIEKTIKEIISKADKALYHSKETGRNKVTLYSKL